MKSNIKLKCDGCGKYFHKLLKDYKSRTNMENSKDERKTLSWYCSKACAGKWAQWDNKLSPFKYPISCAKATSKCKGYKFDLTAGFLARLWDKQEGKCGSSGLKMGRPLTHSESRWQNKRCTPFIGSLDRIDCSGGYTKDNVHFICLSLNYAKRNWSEDVFKVFLRKLMNHKTRGEVVELVDTTDLKSVGH